LPAWRTTRKTVTKDPFVPIEAILAEVRRRLDSGGRPDYMSLAGSGEPTLHSGIGDLIQGLKAMTDVPVAVLTNGSLLWMAEVRQALMRADLVLPSLDVGDDRLFQDVNRPHPSLSFERMVAGIAAFTREFPGQVWLEVLLLGGITGLESEVKKIAEHVRTIAPARVQLNSVNRPPAEEYAACLSRERLAALGRFFPGPVDVISDGPADGGPLEAGASCDDAEILALLGRRPCTPDDVARGLGLHAPDVVKKLNSLLLAGKARTMQADGRLYYVASP
jgi:wyosine [tRNA(Phe)-imidazoG37] synthetase (radical SAM superfamily)